MQAGANVKTGGGSDGGLENCSLFVMPSRTRGVWHRGLSSQPASRRRRAGCSLYIAGAHKQPGYSALASLQVCQAGAAQKESLVLMLTVPTIGSLTCIEKVSPHGSGGSAEVTTACQWWGCALARPCPPGACCRNRPAASSMGGARRGRPQQQARQGWGSRRGGTHLKPSAAPFSCSPSNRRQDSLGNTP